MSRRRPPRRPLVLRNRNFALVWSGQVLSQGGTRMYQIGLLWWLLSQLPAGTSGFYSGVFLVLGALPPVLLAPYIGRVLEGAPSRRVMLRAELIAGAITAGLAVFAVVGTVPPLAVYPVALALAVCQAFVDPTLEKSVPELVESDDIEPAVAFETSTQSLANFGGAVLGAAVIGFAGFAGVVALNAASYAISATCLFFARFRAAAPSPAVAAAVVAQPGTVPAPAQTLGSWQLLASMPFVRAVLFYFAIANFFAGAIFIVMPLYTKLVLDANAAVLSQLEASLWLGLLVGAFSGGLVGARRSVTLIGAVCIAVNAAALALPGVVANQYVYMAALAVGGWSLGLNNVKFITLFQMVVPANVRGRFFALLQAAIGFTFPAALFVFGALGDHLSPQTLCLLQGAGLLPVAVALALLREPAPTATSPPTAAAAR